jgi:two-component system, cell cycle sensor histidine kinase and response regulator CckA
LPGLAKHRLGMRGQIALVVAAAVAPMALALGVVVLVGASLAWAPLAALAAGVTTLSALVSWRIAAGFIIAPLTRLGRALAAEVTAGESVNDIVRAVAELTSELGLRRNEAASAAIARLAAEEALQRSTDVLRSMVSTLPVGVVAIGRDGRVKLWNHAAETMLGYSAEEMIGRETPADVFSSASVANSGQSGAADVFLRMVTGQRIKSEEVQCRRKDGTTIEVSFSGAPLMDDDERLRGAICVFEDVAQRKAIAAQLQQAQKMEAVGQLTGGMAHDFNNILGIAIGNLDLLELEVTDKPQAAELASIALNALLRGAELTRALLAFARRQPLKPAILDVGELLGAVSRMLTRTLGEQIHVIFRAEGGLWPVLADAAQLEAAITNLAINARDAMTGGGQLVIAAANASLDAENNGEVEGGDYLVIEVSDTGKGMSTEVLSRVFEPFFTTKPVGQGTGLGLSMVYGFMKQSGGHIKIYSEVGHGTTVRLYLPRAGREGGGGRDGTTEARPLPRGSETILVVEDNVEVRRMVDSQLTGLGYKVIAAPHGPAALRVLESGVAVDLLFTDVVMPEGMSGFELAEAARLKRPDLKVLVTSGFPGSMVRADRYEFLGKPYRRVDLARAVRGVLDGPAVSGPVALGAEAGSGKENVT